MVWVQSDDLQDHFSCEDTREDLYKKTEKRTVSKHGTKSTKQTNKIVALRNTHHIARGQHTAEFLGHWIMFHGHEQCVEHNADSDG